MAGFNGSLHYEKMVEDALRGVVRQALEITAKEGLPGVHHFYITFRTHHPGVDISPYLMDRHPEEMTLVLQNQFWGLDVTPDFFEVTLSFNKMNERLHVPFAAVSAFTDPTSKFGLQFNVDSDVERPTPTLEVVDGDSKLPVIATAPQKRKPAAENKTKNAEDKAGNKAGDKVGDSGGKVIALDAFRKK